MKTQLTNFLLPLGLLLIACAFIITHYIKLADGISGFLFGVGIGILLLAIFKQVKKKEPGTNK